MSADIFKPSPPEAQGPLAGQQSIHDARVSNLKPSEVPGVGRKVLNRLSVLESRIIEEGFAGGLPSYLAQWNQSLRKLQKETGVHKGHLAALMDHWDIPRPTPTEARTHFIAGINRTPEHRQKSSQAMQRTMQRRLADPVEREKIVNQARDAMRKLHDNPDVQARRIEAVRKGAHTPEVEARRSVAHKRNWDKKSDEEKQAVVERLREGSIASWQDPTVRAARIENLKNTLADPEKRKLAVERARNASATLWQNPILKARMIEATKERWKDPEFRARIAVARRSERMDPSRIHMYKIPTISGYRGDIDFFAQSAWEANFARVLISIRRDFYVRENFTLVVPQEYQHMFTEPTTQLTTDFITLDPRGNIVIYELMAHPLENPEGYAKADMLIQQFPEIKVRFVTEELYSRLEKRFKRRINSDPKFHGWETRNDSLRTDPEKYERKLV